MTGRSRRMMICAHGPRLPQRLARQGLFAKPCLSSFFRGCTRSPAQILIDMLIKRARSSTPSAQRVLTYAMGARVLPVAFRTELVALVTCPADSPANGPRPAGCPSCGAIGMLAMFRLRSASSKMWVMHPYVLLELLQRIM